MILCAVKWFLVCSLVYSYIHLEVDCMKNSQPWITCSDKPPYASICQIYRHKNWRYKVTCSVSHASQLRNTLYIPHNTTSIILSSYDNCSIPTAPARFITRCPMVTGLYLQMRPIHKLHSEMFDQLTSLIFLTIRTSIDISDPSLVPDSVFDSLHHLTTVHITLKTLDDNSLKLPNVHVLPTNYRGRLYTNLSSPCYLTLDGIPNGDFDKNFANITSLRQLRIVKGITTVTNATFAVFSKIKIDLLALKSPQLFQFDKGALSHFFRLKIFQILYARLSLDDVSAAVSEIKSPYLHNLIITETFNSKISNHLSNNFVQNLSKFPLTKLQIRWCRLSYMEGELHNNFSRLQTLELQDNQLDLYNTDFFSDVSQLHQLRSLTCHNQGVSMNHNHHNTALLRDTKQCISVPIPAGMKTLSLASTFIDHEMPCFNFTGNITLPIIIDLSNNKVQSMKLPLIFPKDLMKLITLIISNNTIMIVSQDAFLNDGYHIKTLIANNNRFDRVLQAKNSEQIFFELSNLTSLELEGNELSELKPVTFIRLKSLKFLNLGNNRIFAIGFDLSRFPCLQVLNLTKNSITSLNESTRHKLNVLAESHNWSIRVDMGENPLICTCETLDFLKWRTKTRVKLTLPPTCQQGDKTLPLAIEPLHNTVLPQLQIECTSLIQQFAIALPCLCLLILGISCITYHYRWDLKFCCLKFVLARKKFMQTEMQEKDYEYDAFVVYHVDDVRWVQYELLPRLEPELKLCVHHRDFIPGLPIEENIADCISRSARVIMLISQTLVTSKWCEMELHLARCQSLDLGQDVIVPIMLEDVDVASMPRTLHSLVRRKTYLEWPHTDTARTQFWETLRHTLQQHRPVHAHYVQCECGNCVEV